MRKKRKWFGVLLSIMMVFGMLPMLAPEVYADSPFVDVSFAEYYSDPVDWAVKHDPQITNGVDNTHFKPGDICTRNQVVTFLWRAMGCPKPTTSANPFVDVKKSDYFYQAVLWAVENNITNGMDENHFAPVNECERDQVVTFLWRAEGQPAAMRTDHPFKDIYGKTWYTDAVLWAVENHITTGTSSTTFSPGATCTRGQIVTFLYRDMTQMNTIDYDDFLMYVEDVFLITDRGVVLTGRVDRGKVRVNDEMRVLTYDSETNQPLERKVTVKGIEMFHKQLDEAEKGDNVGILIDSSDKSLFRRGDALVGKTVPMKSVTGTLVGVVEMKTKEEGGRSTPVSENYKPQVYIGTSDYTGTMTGIAARPSGKLYPGEYAMDITISNLAHPAPVYIGQELTLREGGKTVGTFQVKQIAYNPKNVLKSDDFLMYVEDVFLITDRGVILTGRIDNGKVKVNDKIRVLSYNDANEPVERAFTVKGIEMFHKLLDEAGEGDNVGIQIDYNDKSIFRRGDAMVGQNVALHPLTGTFSGSLYLKTKEEGGRHTPIFDKYKPQVYIGTSDVTGTITGLDSLKDSMLIPGNTASNARISGLVHPSVVFVGQELTLREGGKTVGVFKVRKIY